MAQPYAEKPFRTRMSALEIDAFEFLRFYTAQIILRQDWAVEINYLFNWNRKKIAICQ